MSDLIKYYLNDIKNYPTFSNTEQKELFKRLVAGDESVFDSLVTANLKYVISIAKTYTSYGVDLEELISAGNEGLIKAVRKYDPYKNYEFTTYAVWWIRQNITQTIQETTNLIRIPSNRQYDMQKAKKLEEKLSQELGRSLYQHEIDELSYYDNTYLSHINDVVSLNDLDENDNEVLEYFNPVEENEIEKILEDYDSKRILEELVSECSFKERDILTLYFGIGDIKPMTLDQIGRIYNLSRERIRQIKELTLEKLRDRKNENKTYKN